MPRRTTALNTFALFLLPLGQPLLLGTLGIATATTAVVLHHGAAVAQDASAVARIAKAITIRIEGSTQGSGVIVKREGNRYTVLTAWHVVSGLKPLKAIQISGMEHLPFDRLPVLYLQVDAKDDFRIYSCCRDGSRIST